MTALTVATGRSTFQPKRISWSYRSRGTDARIQMKTDTNTKTLSTNQSGPSGAYGPCQPPKKSVTARPANCGTTNQIVAPCLLTISTRFSDCPISTTPSTDRASETSYDTSCAQVRMDPSSAYFDSEAQPPTIAP